MEYGRIIREAWATTWRYRYLWVLGLFAGGAVAAPYGTGGGGPVEWRTSGEEVEQVAPWLSRAAGDASRWLVANVPLVVGGAALLLALALAFVIVSLIAQGGMARATADLSEGQASSLGRAWAAGLRLFWRYLGLWLLLAGIAILVAVGVGALVALVAGLGIVAARLTQTPPILLVALGALVGVALLIAAILAVIGASIVLAYAQRAIAVRDMGPLAALRAGWELFRTHLGTSLVIWLINVGLAIGAGIAVGLGALAVFAVLGALGAAVWALLGMTAPTIGYIVLGVLLLVAAILTFVAIANTFFWNYWTLAYLRLAGPAAPTPAVG